MAAVSSIGSVRLSTSPSSLFLPRLPLPTSIRLSFLRFPSKASLIPRHPACSLQTCNRGARVLATFALLFPRTSPSALTAMDSNKLKTSPGSAARPVQATGDTSAERPLAESGGQKVSPQQKHKYTNRLAKEQSPYLLQHKHNPVRDSAVRLGQAGNHDVWCLPRAARRGIKHTHSISLRVRCL